MSIKDKISLRSVKYFSAIISAVTIGIVLGIFVTNYELRYALSREYCGSYRGIEVYKCGEINPENFIGHANLLESAPDLLTDACTHIYFMGGGVHIPIVGEKGAALGLTQGQVIYISTDSFNADTVYHELFHAYDNGSGNPSSGYEFKRTADEEKAAFGFISGSGDEYYAEVFASAGAEYLLEPEPLKRSAPKVYAYFEKLLGETK